MKDNLKRKLEKLLILSKRGIGGEKKNASQILRAMLKKYRLTLLDIKSEKEKMYWFKWCDEFDCRLLNQIMYRILGKDVSTWTSRKKRKHLGVMVTSTCMMEIEIEHDAYRQKLKDGLNFYYRAFLQKNEIFPDKQLKQMDRDLTPEEEEAIRMILSMAKNIKKTHIRKQLT
jgi:hypothetical protein